MKFLNTFVDMENCKNFVETIFFIGYLKQGLYCSEWFLLLVEECGKFCYTPQLTPTFDAQLHNIILFERKKLSPYCENFTPRGIKVC